MQPAAIKPLIDPTLLEQLNVRIGTIEFVHNVPGFDKPSRVRPI